ncbi:MAG: glycosyltransferase [Candidatus Microthrix sp.]|jgi:glycosyltransferase involved in cell wall biosynthesis|uniref:glycosyltransferase n=1 Tax=Candidatus Neomicrothrix sp. TaxID=2719034 RepID=UPI001B79A01C|nr:glycosyltransferase [Candidatus Microthrix sp.]MBP6133679.1 glycosyltransferase [Candidatus Microthrix sp.]MBP6150376.1 glycosyltransferase [Candidatus Microthrix sp.]MBP7405127.1 glycosyltransferase [Candidatus Microthrix sp.]MBP7853791.1 glycosyltransferase [Candidatus Microthrix sp.]MBP7988347.1 glycosyltransferase [Candidatus Microthrix sp.]
MDNEAARSNPPVPDLAQPPVLEIAVPVFNEAHVLERSVTTLVDHVRQHVPYPTRLTIADNASSDDTLAVTRRLAANTARVQALHLGIKGRGNALATAWGRSDAAVLGHNQADEAIGSRACRSMRCP